MIFQAIPYRPILSFYPKNQKESVHEPNMLGLTSGSNIVSAEWGANPRDDSSNKREKRGLTMNDCRRMLFEAGYSSVFTSDFNSIPLTEAYLEKTGAF